MEFRPFEEARRYVHKLGIKTHLEWIDYCKSGKKPSDIPSGPEGTYKKEWESWGDWLGTGYIALRKKEYRPFEEARSFVQGLNLKSKTEWEQYCKSGNKPPDIAFNPDKVYSNEWQGWYRWLGTEENVWSVRKVKELLKGLIENGNIYQWDEAVLYSLLLRKGLLTSDNRHKQFFKNIIEASRTNDGRRAIEEYANSDSETPPDLSKITPTVISNDSEQEIQSAFSNELTSLVKQHGDPLDYGDIKTAEQILVSFWIRKFRY
jgi:hypothetical protein